MLNSSNIPLGFWNSSVSAGASVYITLKISKEIPLEGDKVHKACCSHFPEKEHFALKKETKVPNAHIQIELVDDNIIHWSVCVTKVIWKDSDSVPYKYSATEHEIESQGFHYATQN